MNKLLALLLPFSFLFLGCEEKKENIHKKEIQQEIQIKKESELESSQKKLLEEHNKQRESKGIKPLVLDKELCDYAQKHAETMVKKNSLYHSRISNLQKGDANVVGENVAWGQETAESVVKAWMWSPMHRWNILGYSYKKVGFGMAKDKNGKIYWCTVFTD